MILYFKWEHPKLSIQFNGDINKDLGIHDTLNPYLLWEYDSRIFYTMALQRGYKMI